MGKVGTDGKVSRDTAQNQDVFLVPVYDPGKKGFEVKSICNPWGEV